MPRALFLLAAAAACALPAARGTRIDTSGWLGSAYTPSGASNSMWWPWFSRYEAQIDRELAAAARHLGVNTLRVFLHPKVFEANSSGLLGAVDRFLALAAGHGISTGLVLFDSCWATDGSNVSVECVPTKGVHNGCWHYGPELADMTSLARFRPYTEAVVGRFGNDTARVRWIEVYNEPRGPNEAFVFALRDAAYQWALALRPLAPLISCWDDNNNTQILDHHEYDVAFATKWQPALYANPAKGAVITEGGSRWYQPPFSGDYGSPLTVINFLQALRRQAAAGALPFVPGAILNWELQVGNSNTRWHWGSAPGAREPAVPWDGWMWPSGTPVSYTEAAALRRYATGRDDFLSFSKFLTQPPVVEDGDAFLALPAGGAWAAPSSEGLLEGVYEAAVWLEAGGYAALALCAELAPAPPRAPPHPAPRTVRVQGAAAARPRKRHGAAPLEQPPGGHPPVPPPSDCAFQARMNDTDVCSGGPPGYRDLSVAGAPDALGACAAACCAWANCTAWIVRHLDGTDGNCSSELCCWLKPGCAPGSQTPAAGAVSAFRAPPPGPPAPPLASGYAIALNASSGALSVERVAGGARTLLGTFDTGTLENGLVLGAWNLLRVEVAGEAGGGGGLALRVFFNSMFPETGLVGNSSDALRVPLAPPPRLALRDAAPLPPGGALLALAGAQEARFDYVAALPLSVL